MNLRSKYCILVALVILPSTVFSEWTPSGSLANIPVIENCQATGGDIAVARPGPVIYYCQAVADRLNQFYPGAGHFYYVHEFGHHALSTSNEKSADCWAAKQLSQTKGGGPYISAAIAHFRARGNEYHPRYGTMNQRADTIQSCANKKDEKGEVKYGRSCCTNLGKCGPFLNQPALPLESACSCQYGNPNANGEVCR